MNVIVWDLLEDRQRDRGGRKAAAWQKDTKNKTEQVEREMDE